MNQRCNLLRKKYYLVLINQRTEYVSVCQREKELEIKCSYLWWRDQELIQASAPQKELFNCCFSLSRNKLGCGALICHPLSGSYVEIRPRWRLPWSHLTDMQIHAIHAHTWTLESNCVHTSASLCFQDQSCSAHSVSIMSLTLLFTKNWQFSLQRRSFSLPLFSWSSRQRRERAASHGHTGNGVGKWNRIIGALGGVRGLWSLWEWLTYVCVTSSCPAH